MARRPARPVKQGTSIVEKHVPPDLRPRLETARLDILSLLRALDSLHLAEHLPRELRAIFELDADFAEALAVLEHPAGGYDLVAMRRDTLASLDELPTTKTEFLETLAPADRERLDHRVSVVRAMLTLRDAYSQVPGGGPRRG